MTHPRTEQRIAALRNGEPAITTEEAERRMNEKASNADNYSFDSQNQQDAYRRFVNKGFEATSLRGGIVRVISKNGTALDYFPKNKTWKFASRQERYFDPTAFWRILYSSKPKPKEKDLMEGINQMGDDGEV